MFQFYQQDYNKKNYFVNPKRRLSNYKYVKIQKKNQKGKGITDNLSTISNIISMGSEISKIISETKEIYRSEAASKLKNTLTELYDKNPLSTTGFPGESHIMIPTDYGWSMSNYCGPGTKVDYRLKRGDIGVDGFKGVDEQCKKHDIDYVNAKNNNDIRKADMDLIKNIKKSEGRPIIKKVITKAMEAKVLSEDLGLFKPSDFTDIPDYQKDYVGNGKIHNLSDGKIHDKSLRAYHKEESLIIKKKQKNNRKKKYLPGERLRKKLLKSLYD